MAEEFIKIDDETMKIETSNTTEVKITKAELLEQKAKIEEMLSVFDN